VERRVTALAHASEKFATQNEILQHENKGLYEAIFAEKKRRKRGKAMGLIDPENSVNQAIFFSPEKVARARERAAEKEQSEQQRKQNIEDRKLQAAINREEKAYEATERKQQRSEARLAKKKQQEQEKADRASARAAARA
jgi:hypothetical protein